MKSQLKILIISTLLTLFVAPIIAQTNTGSLTLKINDCVFDEDNYWSNYYTLSVSPNSPIKINYTFNTHDYFMIYTYDNGAFHSYVSQSVPTNGEQSVTVISTTGNIYIGCDYGGSGMDNDPIFSLNYLIDVNSTTSSNLSMIMNDQYIKGKLGVGIPAREKLDVDGNAIISNKLSLGSSNFNSAAKLSISNNSDPYSLYCSSSKNSASSLYGLYSATYNSSGNVYGIYSTVSGQTGKKWAGYFTGGDVAVTSGNMGVGVESPLGILHVRGTGDNAWIYFGSNAGFTKPKPKIAYGLAFTWNLSGSEGESIINYSGGPRLDFTSWDGTNLTTEMSLKKGSLGIGTTVPGATLDVAGDARFQNTTSIEGSGDTGSHYI